MGCPGVRHAPLLRAKGHRRRDRALELSAPDGDLEGPHLPCCLFKRMCRICPSMRTDTRQLARFLSLTGTRVLAFPEQQYQY
jgi:hypothetical protein